jgi:hypothetical protein
MSSTSHPVSVLPAIVSHGNPAAVAAIRPQTCARAFARAFAILPRARASARSSVRRTVVSDGGAPKTSSWWSSSAMSRMLVAPSTIATATGTSATPLSISGNFPARASGGPSAAVSPVWSASLRSSTAPACPVRPSASAVTDRSRSHRVSFNTKSAPGRGNYIGVVTA